MALTLLATGYFSQPFLAIFLVKVRFKNNLEPTYVDTQLWFLKYSPIFSFLIRPNFGPFCHFWALWGYFWGCGQVQKLFWDLLI